MARATFSFPTDFLWGTASAAHQVEGGNTNNDWWAWEQAGHTQSPSGLACNWWDLSTALADLDRAAELNTNAHRLSLEWSRIEPEPSVFDEDAIAQYRALLEGMHSRGIQPMVTLHHFTNPRWLVEKGDFQSDVVVDYFQRYTKKVVEKLGDLIPHWITFNEPIVYFYLRHMAKQFPPPQDGAGWAAGLRGLRYMLAAHAAAYETIKAQYPHTQVGVAKQFRPFEAWPNGNALDRWWARRISWLFNDVWMQAMHTGWLGWPLGRGRIRGLAGTFDFVGINYYTRNFVRFPKLETNQWPEGTPLSDDAYGEIYPRGIYWSIQQALSYKKPIFITENGLPDSRDKNRSAFIITHLHQIWHAISFNYPVMGYYHWSLTDNFEWERGWSQRFGLYELNPETQERTLRDSGRLYGEIAHARAITTPMIERYAIHLVPHLLPGRT